MSGELARSVTWVAVGCGDAGCARRDPAVDAVLMARFGGILRGAVRLGPTAVVDGRGVQAAGVYLRTSRHPLLDGFCTARRQANRRPAWETGLDYFEKMSAEVSEEREDSRGRIKVLWVQKRRDNHHLDCELMIDAAAVISGNLKSAQTVQAANGDSR